MTCARALVTAAACLLAAAPAWAAPKSVNAQARAVTISPLSLLKINDLSFGNLIPGKVSGTVTIAPRTDAPTYAGVIGLGGTIGAARFLGAGTAGQLVNISWNPAAITLTRVGGGATMRVDTFRTNGGFLVGANDLRVIPADRLLDIRFGARLLVGANQQEGDYSGSFTVTVEYL